MVQRPAAKLPVSPHLVRRGLLVVMFSTMTLVGLAAPAFASNGAPLIVANQMLDGNLPIPPGSWVSAGYHYTTHGKAPVTFNDAQVTLPVSCASDGSVVGTIIVQLAIGPYSANGNSETPWIQPSSTNPLAYQGAVQAPNLCSGGTMYNSGGASFSTNVASGDSTTVILQFHYAVPAALGQTNTNCADASSPGATDASICGTSLSASGSVAPTPGSTPNVVPVVTCVSPGSEGGFSAYFGYSNSGTSVNYPLGGQNFVSPSNLEGGEPTTFTSGSTTNAFSVAVASGKIATWTVAGQSATAQSTSTLCSGSTLSQDPFGMSLVIAIGGGVLVGTIVIRRASRERNPS